MKEKWEEVFDIIAHSIATMLAAGCPPSPPLIECVKGWLDMNDISARLKQLSERETIK